MVKVRIVPKAEAQQTQRPKQPGVRRARMTMFDEFTRVLQENPDQAAVYEELEEQPQRWVLSLRGAFQRAGMDNAVVRKMRGRDEVRAWLMGTGSGGGELSLPGEDSQALREEVAALEAESEAAELEREPAEVTEMNAGVEIARPFEQSVRNSKGTSKMKR